MQIKRALYVFIATLFAVTTMPDAIVAASPAPTQTLDVSTYLLPVLEYMLTPAPLAHRLCGMLVARSSVTASLGAWRIK